MPEKCETCGSKVSSYPMGCPGCGAPNCCQRCCDEDSKALSEIQASPDFKPLLDALKPIPTDALKGGLWDCEDCYPKLCHCQEKA